GHKKKMYAQIAAITFDDNKYYFGRRELEALIEEYLRNVPPHRKENDGDVVLVASVAQHGIFTERASNIYSFSHLTFQEYFCAKYIVDNAKKGMLYRTAKHCGDNRWREVFLLIACLLDDASDYIQLLRNAIDDFVPQDTKLAKLLTWATKKRH